jgi:hypothetical protein
MTEEREAIPDLLRRYAAIMATLRERKVIHSSNNPVADYAEGLAVRAFDLDPATSNAAGFDAVDRVTKVRYQVKGRRITAPNASRELSALRGLPERSEPLPGKVPFDVLIAILFNEDFSVWKAASVPVAVVHARATDNPHVAARRLLLVDSVWDEVGVECVTDQIRAAAESWV